MDGSEGGAASAAGRFAAFALAALALFLIAVPTAVVALLALVLDGRLWPLLVAVGLFAAAVAAGWAAARRLRVLAARIAAPRRWNRVFISFRTAEHGPEAERVAAALRREGFEVFLAKSGDVVVDERRPQTFFRTLSLFQLGELDADLQQALITSDAVVYLVPTRERRIALWRSLRDQYDALLSSLLFQSGLSRTSWRFMWYAGMYGRTVTPASRLFELQSWQEWELALARELGVEVVKVRFGVPAEDGDGEIVWCRPEALEADVATAIAPRVRAATRAPLEVRGPLPAVVAATAGVALLATVGMLALGAGAAFLAVRALV